MELLNDIFQDPVISFNENLYFWNGMYYERKEKDECRHIITRYQATTPIKRRVNGKWVLNRDIDPDLTTKLYNSALDNYFVNPSFVNTGGINCNNGVLVFDFIDNTLVKKLIPHDYNLNGYVLQSVNEFTDLGVVITNNLSWNKHVENLVTKSNKRLGLIKRTVGYDVHSNVKKQCYISLCLLYTSPSPRD